MRRVRVETKLLFRSFGTNVFNPLIIQLKGIRLGHFGDKSATGKPRARAATAPRATLIGGDLLGVIIYQVACTDQVLDHAFQRAAVNPQFLLEFVEIDCAWRLFDFCENVTEHFDTSNVVR
jgi:hypothetical protein